MYMLKTFIRVFRKSKVIKLCKYLYGVVLFLSFFIERKLNHRGFKSRSRVSMNFGSQNDTLRSQFPRTFTIF